MSLEWDVVFVSVLGGGGGGAESFTNISPINIPLAGSNESTHIVMFKVWRLLTYWIACVSVVRALCPAQSKGGYYITRGTHRITRTDTE